MMVVKRACIYSWWREVDYVFSIFQALSYFFNALKCSLIEVLSRYRDGFLFGRFQCMSLFAVVHGTWAS